MEESETLLSSVLSSAEHQAKLASVGHVEPNEGRNRGVGSVGIFANSLKFGMNPTKGRQEVQSDG